MRRTGAYVGAVAFMVVGVHGTAMTLSAIETVGSFAVPLSCIFAYNTPILGCETSDLSAGQCSSRCQRGLLRVQNNIRASCDTVDAQPPSLIWQAQRGNLVNALCMTVPPPQPSTRQQPQPTSSTTSEVPVTVTIPKPSSTSSETSLSTSSTLTTTSTTSTTTSTTQPTVSSTTSTSSSSTEPPETTQTETEVNSTISSSSTESTTAAESSTTSSSSTSTTKAAKPTRDPELGAGDPFANVPNSSSELGPYIWGILMIVFAICLA
ncbi:hypothetical protein IF1G_09480 [Cordyceps javanica]|uniref:Uncharacterized protein n=1 Tax=Cordyceps javanica TaxID=43265 RepID=A0A545UR05_9HYPO|nr:hypothetical protein IF1G_09480 [Cordyceps javanica]TQW03842.1 hypothetical protein IF2G_08671 [Cordyceps javanica]